MKTDKAITDLAPSRAEDGVRLRAAAHVAAVCEERLLERVAAR